MLKEGENLRPTDKPAGEDKERIYSYSEAIDIAGLGRYTRCLLFTMCLSILSMVVDMFGFSVVVTGCACDFNLNHLQKTLLIASPFVGPVVMAYIWGYLSDTKGRKWTLLLGLWGGFIVSTLSAFSINWYMLGALKIISTSFSSAVQSASFTLMGESCPERVKSRYILIMSAAMVLLVMAYVVPGYFILNLKFSYNLSFIKFTPWRLLCLVIAAPLGISAILLHFFCESPKILLSLEKEKKALKNLNFIWKRNKGIGEYPVKHLKLLEGGVSRKQHRFCASLYAQLTPLFKPPLLWTTLKLFYLIAVVYGINNSIIMWMPIIVEAFTSPSSQHAYTLCDVIASSNNSITGSTCVSTISKYTLVSGVGHGLLLGTITLVVSMFGSRKKIITIIFLLIPLLSTVAVIFIKNNIASLTMYICMMTTNVCMGTVFAYIVELYPTAYTGMAACLGVMVSRVGALICIHFVGILVKNHCVVSMGSFSVYLFSGAVVACFLPRDKVFK